MCREEIIFKKFSKGVMMFALRHKDIQPCYDNNYYDNDTENSDISSLLGLLDVENQIEFEFEFDEYDTDDNSVNGDEYDGVDEEEEEESDGEEEDGSEFDEDMYSGYFNVENYVSVMEQVPMQWNMKNSKIKRGNVRYGGHMYKYHRGVDSYYASDGAHDMELFIQFLIEQSGIS